MKLTKNLICALFAVAVISAGIASAKDFVSEESSTGSNPTFISRLAMDPVGVRYVKSAWVVEGGKNVLNITLSSVQGHPGYIGVILAESVLDSATGSTLTCAKGVAFWRAPKG